MTDKYSKIEEKVEEGKRRVGLVEKVLGDFLQYVEWEIVSVKNDANNIRINFVKIIPKNSVVRFALNQKKEILEKQFEKEFLANEGRVEKMSLRIG